MKDIQAFSCRCVSCLGRLDMLPRFWWTARSKSLRSSRQRSGESFFETRSLDQFSTLHNFLSPGCGNGRRRERLQCCPSWTGDPGVACLPQDCWRGWGGRQIFILFWLNVIFIIYDPFSVWVKAVLQPRSNGTSDFNEHLESHRVPGNHVSTLWDSGDIV